MKTDRHKLLITSEESDFVVKALSSVSIKEPRVPVNFNGVSVGDFHAIEVFENVACSKYYPQTISDIVSNTYVRLTYKKSEGISGTFGTSIVGAISFRTSDGILHLIPEVQSCLAQADIQQRLKIEVMGSYGEYGLLTSVRNYASKAIISCTTMTIEVTLSVIKDMALDRYSIGRDAFRLFTISSMYSSEHCYDGNAIKWTSKEGVSRVKRLDVETSGYIFEATQASDNVELLKEIGTLGKRGAPGAADAPSVSLKVVDSSIPLDQLGLQAYYTGSSDIDEDSLSVWIEWIKCPHIISKGVKIWAKIEVSAFQ